MLLLAARLECVEHLLEAAGELADLVGPVDADLGGEVVGVGDVARDIGEWRSGAVVRRAMNQPASAARTRRPARSARTGRPDSSRRPRSPRSTARPGRRRPRQRLGDHPVGLAVDRDVLEAPLGVARRGRRARSSSASIAAVIGNSPPDSLTTSPSRPITREIASGSNGRLSSGRAWARPVGAGRMPSAISFARVCRNSSVVSASSVRVARRRAPDDRADDQPEHAEQQREPGAEAHASAAGRMT